jgi:hypothetical protein
MNQESPTRFKLKMGAAEIEFEGSSEFLKAEVLPTVEKLLAMVDARVDLQRTNIYVAPQSNGVQRLSNPSHENSNVEIENLDDAEKGLDKPITSLATYLKTKDAGKNQNQRLLATAGWLHKKGNREITATLISETLLEHQQTKLGNPADCLNQNVRKGHCEKTKTGFFITPEGWIHLDETK